MTRTARNAPAEAGAGRVNMTGAAYAGLARTSARLPMPWLGPAAVFFAALAVLFLRRPETLTRPELYADDGPFYMDAMHLGASSLVATYGGYLAVIQRAVVLLEAAVPPLWAPLVGNLAALVAIALVAAFLASDRLSAVLPSRGWRLVLAAVFVLLPAVDRVIGTASEIQWPLAVYLVALLVATPPTSARGRFGDALGILVVGLTGPTIVLLWPLYAVRAVREPVWRWHLAWATLAALIQVVFVATSFRAPTPAVDASLLPAVLASRLLVVPVTGIYGPGYSVALAVVVLVALALALWRLPRRWVAGALFVAVVFALAGVKSTTTPTAGLADPQLAGRYFYLAGVVIAGLVVVALSRRKLLAVPLALLLAVGIVADARIPPIPSAGWAEHAACIGGPVPCSAPVFGGPPWWVYWP